MDGMAGRAGTCVDVGRVRTLPGGIPSGPAPWGRCRAVDCPSAVDAPSEERRTVESTFVLAPAFVDVDRLKLVVLDDSEAEDAVDTTEDADEEGVGRNEGVSGRAVTVDAFRFK